MSVKFVEPTSINKIFIGRFEEAPYPENFFDVVTFINVLDYIPQPTLALIKAYRLLRPGGMVIVRTPNAFFHVSWRRIAIKLYKIWRGIRDLDKTTIHLYSFDKKTISKYFKKTGFKKIVVSNGRLSYAGGHRKTNITKISALFMEALTEGIRLLSGGNYIVGPVLFARACKPL
jgi:ubiquinone/menaquinone biosynthesis C-methylase UbiE